MYCQHYSLCISTGNLRHIFNICQRIPRASCDDNKSIDRLSKDKDAPASPIPWGVASEQHQPVKERWFVQVNICCASIAQSSLCSRDSIDLLHAHLRLLCDVDQWSEVKEWSNINDMLASVCSEPKEREGPLLSGVRPTLEMVPTSRKDRSSTKGRALRVIILIGNQGESDVSASHYMTLRGVFHLPDRMIMVGLSYTTASGWKTAKSNLCLMETAQIHCNRGAILFKGISLTMMNDVGSSEFENSKLSIDRNVVVVEGRGAKALLLDCNISAVMNSHTLVQRTALTVLRGAQLICRNVLVNSSGLSIYGNGKASLSLRETSLCSMEAEGLVMAGGVEANMVDCVITNCKQSGVKMSANSRLCAYQSCFSRNGRCGLEAFASCVALVKCTASNNLAGGLLLSSSNGSASFCSFLRNRLANVTSLDSSELLLSDSVSSYSNASGVFVSGENSLVYSLRSIYENNSISNFEKGKNGSFIFLHE